MTYRGNPVPARSSSDVLERPDAGSLASGKRATVRRRVRRIRRSVTLFAAALFSAAFLMVYVQLASGHDPALVADAKRASAQVGAVTSSTRAAAATGTGSSGEESSSGSSAATESGASKAVSTVTTSQS